MKTRWIAIGAGIGLALALTLGFAFGPGSAAFGGQTKATSRDASDWWAAMDAMHDLPGMEQMREHMRSQLAAECDQLHEQMRNGLSAQDPDQFRQHMTDQMREHMGDVGGFGPGGMMSGSGFGPGGMMGS